MPDVTGPAAWITAARARAEAATGGPWQSVPDDTPAPLQHGWGVTAEGITEMPIVAIDWGVVTEPDAAFIAAARDDLPAALDALSAVLALCDTADPQGLGAHAAGYSDALDAVRAVITDTLRSTR